MRIILKSRASLRRPFQFLTAGGTIDVTKLSQGEVGWTWHDGADYRLRFPLNSMWQTPMWHIRVADDTICSGHTVNASFRDSILLAALPHREWDYGGQVIHDEPAYCSGVMRRADKRRIAVWKRLCSPNGWAEIICRDGIPKTLVPLLLGMLVSNLYNPREL